MTKSDDDENGHARHTTPKSPPGYGDEWSRQQHDAAVESKAASYSGGGAERIPR